MHCIKDKIIKKRTRTLLDSEVCKSFSQQAEARGGPHLHSRGPSPSRRSGSESRSPVGDRAPPKLSGASEQLYARAPAWFGPNCNSSWADQVGARSPGAAEWGNGGFPPTLAEAAPRRRRRVIRRASSE